DMGGEMAIDEQRLALRYWMRAHDWVRRLREDFTLVVAAHQHIGPAIDVTAGVRGGQCFEIDLHTGRQRVISRRLDGEQGMAAASAPGGDRGCCRAEALRHRRHRSASTRR